MSKNFNDVLAEIKKIKTTIPVYVPSQGKEIEIKALTLAQQKIIIESSVDTSLSVLFFNTTFCKILEQNLPDKISNYDTVDRVNFALALRKQLKDTVELDGNTYNISSILEANKRKSAKFEPTVVESTNFKIYVKKPDIEYDNRINSILLRKYKDENIKSNKLKTLISDLFAYEIFKFIEKIEVQSSGNQIDLKSNINEGVEMIEAIDGKEFVNVVKQINILRDIEKEFTKIPDTNLYIDIVPDFFVV